LASASKWAARITLALTFAADDRGDLVAGPGDGWVFIAAAVGIAVTVWLALHRAPPNAMVSSTNAAITSPGVIGGRRLRGRESEKAVRRPDEKRRLPEQEWMRKAGCG